MASIDWHGMLVPTVSVVELVIRGTALYFVIFIFMRVFRRQAGALSMADLLVIVLVADAAQNAMAAEYRSITEGAVLVATIFFWNLALDFLSFHSKTMNAMLNPKPLPLILDGRVQRKNLRTELMTLDELKELVHEQGVEDIGDVRKAYLEPDGHVSVIRKAPEGTQPRQRHDIG
jgi:uncharacterized membrane protein YcaP (DUF421 family)